MEQASLYIAMLSAFGLGLKGAGRCLGMCGGIAVWTIGMRYAAGLLLVAMGPCI